VDAVAYQFVPQGDGTMTANVCEIAADRPPDAREGASIEFESTFTDTLSVVVENFPFGNPGAPIPGLPHGPSPYNDFGEDWGPWGPFRSQRDWDIARWAKTHGTTSTAVAELLAMPGVCIILSSVSMSLIQDSRSPRHSGFPITRSSN
jgi:hypothetical protein